jgi:hypothetical protein
MHCGGFVDCVYISIGILLAFLLMLSDFISIPPPHRNVDRVRKFKEKETNINLK